MLWSHLCGEVPWPQLIGVLLFVPIDDGSEDAGQVAVRLDLVQIAGLDQRREHPQSQQAHHAQNLHTY